MQFRIRKKNFISKNINGSLLDLISDKFPLLAKSFMISLRIVLKNMNIFFLSDRFICQAVSPAMACTLNILKTDQN